jgi:Na+/H+ antiporter
MAHLTFIFSLIGMTAISGILARYIRWLPLPWVQIILGTVIAALGVTINFDPSLFLALFIPPLLFADAWRIPKREIISMARPILSLATLLVLATVIGGGYFVNWLIPAIPLSAAFVLASVLSPTDAVAVSAVAARSPMPSKMLHLLEGESLFNDASGLVAFNVALAAMITGSFSAFAASIEFVQVALGGLLIGAALALVFSQIVKMLITKHGDTLGHSISLCMITLPFASYLFAEHFHFSGILAAVAAGIVLNYRSIVFQMSGSSQISIGPLWSVLAFAFNGIIFILLGSQIPQIARDGIRSAQTEFSLNLGSLLTDLTLIAFALLFIRFVWIALGIFSYNRSNKGASFKTFPWRIIFASTVAGIRGAVTLAAVLSLPLTLTDGSPFPGRDLIIFLATGVILVTLLLGTVALPAILNGQFVQEDHSAREQKLARSQSMRAAIELLSSIETTKEESPEIYEEARIRLIGIYQKRIELFSHDETGGTKAVDKVDLYVRKLWAKALKVEREEIYRMRKKHKISDHTLHLLMDDLNFAEKTLKARG